MSGAGTDRPNRIPWPPLLYGGAILIAMALQRLLPLPDPAPDGALAGWIGSFGWALLAVTGIGLVAFTVPTIMNVEHNHRQAQAAVESIG